VEPTAVRDCEKNWGEKAKYGFIRVARMVRVRVSRGGGKKKKKKEGPKAKTTKIERLQVKEQREENSHGEGWGGKEIIFADRWERTYDDRRRRQKNGGDPRWLWKQYGSFPKWEANSKGGGVKKEHLPRRMPAEIRKN